VGVMRRKRLQKSLIAAVLITLIGVAATELYVVRDLLAALVVFCILLFGAIGMTILVSFLLGEGIVRSLDLLFACAVLFGLRKPLPPVAGPVTHGIGKI
jgi:hypothetical protein